MLEWASTKAYSNFPLLMCFFFFFSLIHLDELKPSGYNCIEFLHEKALMLALIHWKLCLKVIIPLVNLGWREGLTPAERRD